VTGTPRIPLTTYRLQFHGGFRLRAARGLVAYLDALGVTDLYASPLTAARPGSGHGYDVIDPARLNPEIGTERSLAALTGLLRRRGMGLLLDIVPNHMAASTSNPWWRDLLARGSRSTHAGFFDIDRDGPSWSPRQKVVLPVLGKAYRDCLRAGHLRITYEDGGLHLRYGAVRLPIDVRSWDRVLRPVLTQIMVRRGRASAALRRLGIALERLARGPGSPAIDAAAARRLVAVERETQNALAAAGRALPRFRQALLEQIQRINEGENSRPGRQALADIVSVQNYRLIHWRRAGALINYRRFFNIGGLVCLRMDDRRVFDAWHPLVLRLVKTGRIQGLRIDHVDGLRRPGQYLRRLRAACGRPLYIVVEKILVGNERLPSRWPVAGTTGYDFLDTLNSLFVHPIGAASLRRIYARFTGDRRRFEDLVYRAKRRLLASDFRGQMKELGAMLLRVVATSGGRRGASDRQLLRALGVTTACVPVYRTYIDDGPAPFDREVVRRALSEARRRAPRLPAAAFSAVSRALLPRGSESREAPHDGERWSFIMRWQQLTGPLMAKGHEDTALYIDHHLISLNDVGGSPDAAGLSTVAFHRLMGARLRRSPNTMNATSTHDTKRGEDVRARIDVLSELPSEWEARLRAWHRWNRSARTRVRGRAVPTRAEEVLIYQTLLGAWPADRGERRGFGDRVKAFLVKAAREAKEHTSWNDPDERHEAALRRFVDVILDRSASERFLASFCELQETTARAGAINGLAQVVIKATAPGVPDFYQGSELWDLNLVDPDNRRPVDFARRRSLLASLQREEARDRGALLRSLLADPRDPRIKLYTTWQALRLRRRKSELFRRGRYLPIDAVGIDRERICAFARKAGKAWAITVVPRFSAARVVRGQSLPGTSAWGNGAIRLSRGAPRVWRNVLTGETVRAEGRGVGCRITLGEILKSFPVALLTAGPRN